MQGPVRETDSQGHALHLPDINAREVLILVPIAIMILWIGIYPKPFLDRTAAAVTRTGEQVAAATNPAVFASAR
jgi:NADH-quinone oxidoreductase subunit M